MTNTSARQTVTKDGITYLVPRPLSKLQKFLLANAHRDSLEVARELNRTERNVETVLRNAQRKLKIWARLGVTIS